MRKTARPSSQDGVRGAVALIKKAIKIFDDAGEDIAAIHLQEALEVIEFGHVVKPTLARVAHS